MFEFLDKLNGGELIGLTAVIAGPLIAITAIIMSQWRRVRVAEKRRLRSTDQGAGRFRPAFARPWQRREGLRREH